MACYVGLNAAKRSTKFCVIDKDGQILMESAPNPVVNFMGGPSFSGRYPSLLLAADFTLDAAGGVRNHIAMLAAIIVHALAPGCAVALILLVGARWIRQHRGT